MTNPLAARLMPYVTEAVALAASGEREQGFERLLSGIEQERQGLRAMYGMALALARVAVEFGNLGGPGFTSLETEYPDGQIPADHPDSDGAAVTLWAARFIAAHANQDHAMTHALFFGNVNHDPADVPGRLISRGMAELLIIAGDLLAQRASA